MVSQALRVTMERMEIRRSEDTEDVQIVEEPGTKPHHYKRNYFWCPEVDCTSGPVQKMTQHLQKKHKMDPVTAAQVAKRKRRAHLEAIRLKMPNPRTRSSGMQQLELFTSKKMQHVSSPPHTPCVSTTTPEPPLSPLPSPMDTSTPTSSNHCPPVPSCTPSTSGHVSKFHHGGPFLDGFYSHLMTCAGGNRGKHSASQITRYVGKYLHLLNAHTVEERALLHTSHVRPFLESVQKSGIGSSGILHRILAHKAAVQYMCLGVSYLRSGLHKLCNPLH